MTARRCSNERSILVQPIATASDGATLANATAEEIVEATTIDLVVSMTKAVECTSEATMTSSTNGYH